MGALGVVGPVITVRVMFTKVENMRQRVALMGRNSGRVEDWERILGAGAVSFALCILAVVDFFASAATASRASFVAAWQGVTSAAASDFVFDKRVERPVIRALVLWRGRRGSGYCEKSC